MRDRQALLLPDGGRIWSFPRHDAAQDALRWGVHWRSAQTIRVAFAAAGVQVAQILLTRRGKSLLPSGIVAVAGRFAKGANVAVVGPDQVQIARGLTNYSSQQLEKIKGLRTAQIAQVLGDRPYDEAVHRNNMTLA